MARTIEYDLMEDGIMTGFKLTAELRPDNEWHLSMGETYRASGYRTLDEALTFFHRHRPTLVPIPVSRYKRKMEACLPDDCSAEYDRYFKTMDAICSRNPERMKLNGFEMLAAKVSQLNSTRFRESATRALEELRREASELDYQ